MILSVLSGDGQSLTFDTNNRIAGMSYDAAGNLLADGTHTYDYDPENRIYRVDATIAYRYDGEGRRVRRVGGDNLRFIYEMSGRLIAEFDGSTGSIKKEYIYGSSGLVTTIEPANGARYTTADHLGSPRVVTNGSGGVWSRHDYMPFGEELSAGTGGRTTAQGYIGNAGNLRQKFASKERDTETGLDYFGARYYASMQGRFTSSDSFGGTGFNPQSLNRYSYVYNNPLKFIDPTGHFVQDPSESEPKPDPQPYDPKCTCHPYGDDNVVKVVNNQNKDKKVSNDPPSSQNYEYINFGYTYLHPAGPIGLGGTGGLKYEYKTRRPYIYVGGAAGYSGGPSVTQSFDKVTIGPEVGISGSAFVAGSVSVAPTFDFDGILASDSLSEALSKAFSISEEHGGGTPGVNAFATFTFDPGSLASSPNSPNLLPLKIKAWSESFLRRLGINLDPNHPLIPVQRRIQSHRQ